MAGARKHRPAINNVNQESYISHLAQQLAIKKLEDGTASSQIICLYAKAGSQKEQLELDILRSEKQLIEAKVQALADEKKRQHDYASLMDVLKTYNGDDEYYD